jgi:hypothetical protein
MTYKKLEKISRSAVEKFINCPKCFYYQYKYQIKPPYIPFTLNIGVDNLCKNEFDHFRQLQVPHPIFTKNKLDLVPFKHENMDKWRHNFTGVQYMFEKQEFMFYGAVDDIWMKPDGELIVADVKATATDSFNIEEIKQRSYFNSYIRQLEMYIWLLRKNGFKVSDTAYIMYANGRKNEPMFDAHMKFDYDLYDIPCDDSWVEETVLEAMDTLRSDKIPHSGQNCEQCDYLVKRYQKYQSLNMQS